MNLRLFAFLFTLISLAAIAAPQPHTVQASSNAQARQLCGGSPVQRVSEYVPHTVNRPCWAETACTQTVYLATFVCFDDTTAQ